MLPGLMNARVIIGSLFLVLALPVLAFSLWSAGSRNVARATWGVCSTASAVVSYTPGADLPLSSPYRDASKSLGFADGQWVSLGQGGSITLEFSTPISNGAGVDIDFMTVEIQLPEAAFIELSEDGVSFVPLGIATGTSSFDISAAGLASVKFMRIIDDNDGTYAGITTSGYDLDGVEAYNCGAPSPTPTPTSTPAPTPTPTPVPLPPSVLLNKSADRSSVLPGQPVTFTYAVTNDGGETLTDVVVTDDNGTPGYGADDFVVGVVPSLAPGQQTALQAVRYPPVTLCVAIDGQILRNLLVTEVVPDRNGDGIPDVQVTYRQSRSLVDNVYGLPATDPASGWPPKTHTFGNLTGSDRATFRFTNASGAVVLEFEADYISAYAHYPSGFGTLGVSGGDGHTVLGSAASVLSVGTTITTNLNQSPAFYGFTTDSPAPESSFPGWDYVDGYTVVVSGAAFGASGFGSVTVPSVHNSPAKIGSNQALPTPCDSDVTNIATVSAVAGGAALHAAASATVHVAGVAATPAHFTTYKQDQWGGDPNKAGAARLLGDKFASVYPGGAAIGGAYSLTFTSASAVHAFLPQGGGANVLKASATDPTKSDAGEFAGHVLALRLNVDFSDAAITRTGLSALHLKSGKLAGKSVAEVLALANEVVGGSKAALPSGVSVGDLNAVVKKINENYEKGTADRGYLE